MAALQGDMAMFRAVATEQLKLLCLVCVMGNSPSFRALPPDPASACETELYARVGITQCLLLAAAYTAGILLLGVIMKVDNTAAGADGTKGIASVAAGWKRTALRGMLLLAIGLSSAASFLAVATFEDGFRYRIGCATAGMGPRSPLAVAVMVFMALVHGGAAWLAAVSQN
jgi:hypothetical protein